MELKVGDYVRAIDGIWEISAIKTGVIQVEKPRHYHHLFNEDIIKSSPNIIDLIKVGDYVNGELVNEVWKNLVLVGQESQPIPQKEIKSIVTKEQFKSMEYKV